MEIRQSSLPYPCFSVTHEGLHPLQVQDPVELVPPKLSDEGERFSLSQAAAGALFNCMMASGQSDQNHQVIQTLIYILQEVKK